MIQEQYVIAELIVRNLRNLNYALDAMKSQEDVTLTIDWYKHNKDMLPLKVMVCDVGLNDTIRDYLAERIAELKKEFEEL